MHTPHSHTQSFSSLVASLKAVLSLSVTISLESTPVVTKTYWSLLLRATQKAGWPLASPRHQAWYVRMPQYG